MSPKLQKYLETVGNSILSRLKELGETTLLAYQIVVYIFRKPFSVKNLINQMVKIGFNSLPVVLITASL